MGAQEDYLASIYGRTEGPSPSGDDPNSLGYAMHGPAKPVTTEDVNRHFAAYKPSPEAEGVRWLAGHIPSFPEPGQPKNWPEAIGSISKLIAHRVSPMHAMVDAIPDMARAYLGSQANWYDKRPTIPDVLVPPGVPGMPVGAPPRGLAGAGRHLDPRLLPKEWENDFVGPHRPDAPWAQGGWRDPAPQPRTIEQTTRLYRGEPANPQGDPNRAGAWWSRSPEKAQGYAGKGGSTYYVDVPLERMGEVQWRGGDAVLPKSLQDLRQPYQPPAKEAPGAALYAEASRDLEAAQKSPHWPSWGNKYPSLAIAHIKDIEVGGPWRDLVNGIQYPKPNAGPVMERAQAEAMAAKSNPDLAAAAKAARDDLDYWSRSTPLKMWEAPKPPSTSELADRAAATSADRAAHDARMREASKDVDLLSNPNRGALPGIVAFMEKQPGSEKRIRELVSDGYSTKGIAEILSTMSDDVNPKGEVWSPRDVAEAIDHMRGKTGWANFDPWEAHMHTGDVSDAREAARGQAGLHKPPRYNEGETDLYAKNSKAAIPGLVVEGQQRPEFWERAGVLDAGLPEYGDFKHAIDSWVGGPHNARELGIEGGVMNPGPLERLTPRQLDMLAGPMRDLLREHYGSSVPVFRGEVPGGGQSSGRRNLLRSYTTDPEVAAKFAGAGPQRRIFTPEEIAELERQYAATGEASIPGRTYRRDPVWGYVEMLDRHGNPITDTPSVRHDLERLNSERAEHNAARARALQHVRPYDLPVDKSVWATDRFGQKEIIGNSMFANPGHGAMPGLAGHDKRSPDLTTEEVNALIKQRHGE